MYSMWSIEECGVQGTPDLLAGFALWMRVRRGCGDGRELLVLVVQWNGEGKGGDESW